MRKIQFLIISALMLLGGNLAFGQGISSTGNGKLAITTQGSPEREYSISKLWETGVIDALQDLKSGPVVLVSYDLAGETIRIKLENPSLPESEIQHVLSEKIKARTGKTYSIKAIREGLDDQDH